MTSRDVDDLIAEEDEYDHFATDPYGLRPIKKHDVITEYYGRNGLITEYERALGYGRAPRSDRGRY